jgi:shikimate kinase
VADTDKLIEEKAGKTIPEIFREDGEERFRDMESSVIAEVSAWGGQIIATGGGAVLREKNVTALRRNGKLFLLERAAETLVPTEDRPLADNREKMDRLWREREPVYRASADCTVAMEGTPEETAREVESRWQA